MPGKRFGWEERLRTGLYAAAKKSCVVGFSLSRPSVKPVEMMSLTGTCSSTSPAVGGGGAGPSELEVTTWPLQTRTSATTIAAGVGREERLPCEDDQLRPRHCAVPLPTARRRLWHSC